MCHVLIDAINHFNMVDHMHTDDVVVVYYSYAYYYSTMHST